MTRSQLSAMKALILIVCCAALILSSCKDHTITTDVPDTEFSQFQYMNDGSYWVYVTPTADSTKPLFDTLRYVGRNPSISLDSTASWIMLLKSEGRIDTLFWVFNDHQLWEYNISFSMDIRSNCSCPFFPSVRWRLLYDSEHSSIVNANSNFRYDTLPSVVTMNNGGDTIITAASSVHVDNVAVCDTFTKPTIPAGLSPLDVSAARTCASAINFDFRVVPVNPPNFELKDKGVLLLDSTYCSVAQKVVGIYHLSSHRRIARGALTGTVMPFHEKNLWLKEVHFVK